MKNFISFVEGKQEPVVSLSEASDSLRVALAAFESMNCKDKIELKWQ